MKLVGHIFDAIVIADLPADGVSVTVHCGKTLTVRSAESFGNKNRSVEMCVKCRQKSHKFMVSHPNVVVSTVFVLEEVETAKKKGKR